MTLPVRCALALAGACLALASVATLATSQESLEPPPETPAGADWVAEPADSVEDSSVEWGLGAVGQQGSGARRRRRVSFSADSVAGALRTGDDDPLAGGRMTGRAWGGEVAYGRLAPRWGRGLLLGAAAEPWSVRAADRGNGAAFRGRSGDGLAWRRARASGPRARVGIEGFAGRFGSRPLAGFGVSRGAFAAGVLGARGQDPQASLFADRGDVELELATDPRGGWRAEAAARREQGILAWTLRARAGRAAFRSLAEPVRSGPARAMTLVLAARVGEARVTGIAAGWRFRPDADGSRAALEAAWPAGASTWRAGFEEQRGVRRAPTGVAPVREATRQGVWWEWRSGGAPVRLALRQETWGRRPFARDVVRQVLAARADVVLGLGVTARFTHTVYRARRGESVYLPEAETDRLVLRALSGAGERTRAELSIPTRGGTVRGALGLSRGSTPRRAQWSLDWTRRVRLRRSRPGRSRGGRRRPPRARRRPARGVSACSVAPRLAEMVRGTRPAERRPGLARWIQTPGVPISCPPTSTAHTTSTPPRRHHHAPGVSFPAAPRGGTRPLVLGVLATFRFRARPRHQRIGCGAGPRLGRQRQLQLA